jgi:NADH:ubiquinone oxidoreductase subunit 2 (subunit N)
VAIFFYGVAERFVLSKRTEREFPLIVLFIHLGGLLALRLSTFRDLFLALETVTLASYVLAAYERRNRFSTYAGVQYFIVGSLPSALLILAFAFLYQFGGSVALQDRDLLFYQGFGIAEATRRSLLSYDYVFASELFGTSSVSATTEV